MKHKTQKQWSEVQKKKSQNYIAQTHTQIEKKENFCIHERVLEGS